MFSRFKLMMLSYTFLRERIIFNNSLASYEDANLDIRFKEESIRNEKAINDLKMDHPAISTQMVDLAELSDSELFCYKIVGAKSTQPSWHESEDPNPLPTSSVKPYQTKLETIVLALKYA